jgi:hypothetical protein
MIKPPIMTLSPISTRNRVEIFKDWAGVAVGVALGVADAVAVGDGVGVGAITVWPPESEPELARKFASPPYCAVTLCGLPATVNDDVVNCAIPLLSAIAPPAFAPSITNWTVPAAVPDPGELAATVAVKVTL